jgi:hypothetical protein
VSAILDAQRALNKLRRHRQDTGDEKPKRGTWSSKANSHRYAANVANANRARNCGSDSFEVADFSAGCGIGKVTPNMFKR